MSRLKKKQKISGGYKPLVAASLAVTLGVSVASADFAAGTPVTDNTTGANVSGEITQGTDSTGTTANSLAGIYVKPAVAGTATQISITGNTLIKDYNSGGSSTDKNIYGILIDDATAKTTFSATDFKTITIEGLTAGQNNNTAYVFKNAGSGAVDFTNVGLAAGSGAAGTFGIYSNLADAKYDFGTGGATFTAVGSAANSLTDGTKGANAQGIVIGANASFKNNLAFTAVTGQSGASGDTDKNGGDGGSAFGITTSGSGVSTLNLDGNITFTAITGGNGGNGGSASGDAGNGGSAYGIYLDSTNNASLTLAGNGDIIFQGIANGNAGSKTNGQAAAPGSKYVINNAGTGTLTLDGTQIVYANSGSATANVGITDVDGGVYNFGSGAPATTGEGATPATVGTQINGASGVAAANVKITGLSFTSASTKNALTLGGKLGVTAKKVTSAGVGGDAIGLAIDSSAEAVSLSIAENGLLLKVKGGDAMASARSKTLEAGGSATGLAFTTATGNNDITVSGGDISLVLQGGLGDDEETQAGAIALSNTGDGKVIFNTGSSLNVLGAIDEVVSVTVPYGIYHNAVASYAFGTETKFNAITGSTGAEGGTTAGKAGVKGGNAAGIIVGDSMEQEGTLVFAGVAGGTGGAGKANGAGDEIKGGAGGDAVGVVLNGVNLSIKDNGALTFTTITGGAGGAGTDDGTDNGNGGTGGNAYGIVAQNGNSSLSIGNSGTATLTIAGGAGGVAGTGGTGGHPGAGGEAVGILVKGSVTEERSVTQSKLALSGAGSLALTVGETTNTTAAYGLKLDNGVFAGSLNFGQNSIQTKNVVSNTACGIFASGESAIESGIITFASNSFNVGSGTAYVLFNQGNLTLESGVKIKTGATDSAAINSDIANANFVFSSADAKTTVKGANASTNAVGGDIVGFALTENAYLSGVLEVVGGNANGKVPTRAADSGNGYAGGAATGMSIIANTAKKTLDLESLKGLTLNVIGGAGSAADSGKQNGAGGAATGLVISGDQGVTLNGGYLNINLASGLDGDGESKSGALTAINNTMTTVDGKLDIANNGIIVGGKATGITLTERTFAIYNNVENAKYVLGTAAGVSTIGTTGRNVAGGSITGLILEKSAEVSGRLTVTGGNANGNVTASRTAAVGDGFNGGDAIGVEIKNATLTIGSDKLTLTLTGGNATVRTSGNTDGKNGGATAFKISGTSTIKGVAEATLINGTTASLDNNPLYLLDNAGNLTLDETAKISVGTGATANIYAAASQTANVVMQAGSTTTFKGATAIGGTGTVNVTMSANSTAIFEKAAFGAGGTVNLDLQGETNKTAKLVFGGEAGSVNTLSGSNADILLAGADQEAVNARFNSKAFTARTLTIADMQLNDSTFVLAAKTTGATGVDSIEITDGGLVDNNIAIVLDSYSTSSAPVTLATVATAAQDKVIFNGLTKNDKTANSVVYSGFTTAEVEIKREEDAGKGVKYTSTLESTNIQVNTDFVAPATAALSAGVSLFSANLNSLSKRMGELRNDPYSQGAWARVFGGEQTTNFGAKQSTVYSTVQAGYDYKLALGDAANYIGAAISYTKGMGGQVNPAIKTAPTPLDLPVAGLTSSDTDGVEVAVYNSYVANSGLYSDTIAKFGYYMTDLTMPLIDDTQSTSNLAVAVSEEIGYKVSLGESNEWFITPQGEVAFAYITGSEFKQISVSQNGASVLTSTQDAVSLLRARVGAAWGYDFSYLAKESDVKASIYLGTYYAYDYFIGGDTTLATTVKGKAVEYKHNAYEGTGRFVMNLGTNIDVQDRTKVYFDFEKSFGGNIQTDYQISLGVRFGFGEKVSAPKPEEKKSSEAILKPKELDESAE